MERADPAVRPLAGAADFTWVPAPPLPKRLVSCVDRGEPIRAADGEDGRPVSMTIEKIGSSSVAGLILLTLTG